MHTSRQCLSTFWEGGFSIDSFTFHGGRFCHNKITQYHFHSISFSFMSIAKITCYLIPFSALRKFSLRNTYTCITNNYSIYMVIISMLYYLIKTIFINNWNICIKVKKWGKSMASYMHSTKGVYNQCTLLYSLNAGKL